MRYVGALIATALVGFVAFQNCQKAPNPNDMTNSTLGSQNVSGKVDLQSEKISEVSFVFPEVETVTRIASNYQVEVNKTLKVNLQTGEANLTSDLDNSNSKYCLTETLRNELVNILKSSQVCQTGPKSSEGLVCTQVMKMAYAHLVTEKDTFALGSATDGCGSNSVDLCDEQAQVFQGFISSIKKNYKNLICAQ